MKRYRLVSYTTRGIRYLQIVRDVKKDGRWTTRTVVHIGVDNEQNRKKAEELVRFLKSYASGADAIAVGTVEEDFFAGLRLGIVLGPLSLPAAPVLFFRDLIYSLNYYIAHASGSVERVIDATQQHLSEGDRKRLAEWINSIRGDREKATALFFKWSFEE